LPQLVVNADAGVEDLKVVTTTEQVLSTDFGTHVDQNVTIVQPAVTTTINAATNTVATAATKIKGGGCVTVDMFLDDGRLAGDIKVGDFINIIDPDT
jgi:diaminopimelate decarboxylase